MEQDNLAERLVRLIKESFKQESEEEWRERLRKRALSQKISDPEIGLQERNLKDILDMPEYMHLKDEFYDYLDNNVLSGLRGKLLRAYTVATKSLEYIERGMPAKKALLPLYILVHVLYRSIEGSLGGAIGAKKGGLEYITDMIIHDAGGIAGLAPVIGNKISEKFFVRFNKRVEERVAELAEAWVRNRIREEHGLSPIAVRKDLADYSLFSRLYEKAEKSWPKAKEKLNSIYQRGKGLYEENEPLIIDYIHNIIDPYLDSSPYKAHAYSTA